MTFLLQQLELLDSFLMVGGRKSLLFFYQEEEVQGPEGDWDCAALYTVLQTDFKALVATWAPKIWNLVAHT